MAVTSPEVNRWPELPLNVDGKLDPALSGLSVVQRDNVLAALGVLERSDIRHSRLSSGIQPGEIGKTIIPLVGEKALQLGVALSPYKTEGGSWADALRLAGNSVAERVIPDTEDWYTLGTVMATARFWIRYWHHINTRQLEWDLARVAGWAMVERGPNPYLPLAELYGYALRRASFRRVLDEGTDAEMLVVDFRMNLEEDRLTERAWAVACVAQPLVSDRQTLSREIYTHSIGEDCQRAKILDRPRRQILT